MCLAIAELNLLISIVFISNFVSAVNDLPREAKLFAQYSYPNFFRSRNGLLSNIIIIIKTIYFIAMDLFLLFIILGLLIIIFLQKN